MCNICFEPFSDMWRPVRLVQCEHLYCWRCLASHVVHFVERTCDAWLTRCPVCRVSSPSAVLLGVVGRTQAADGRKVHVFVHGTMIAVQQLHAKQSSSTQKAREETHECERLDAIAYEELECAVEAQVGPEGVDAWWCTIAAELAMQVGKQTGESLRRLCLGTHTHLLPDHVTANFALVRAMMRRTLADPVLAERIDHDDRTVDVLVRTLPFMAEAGRLSMSLAVVEHAIERMCAPVPSRVRRRPQWHLM